MISLSAAPQSGRVLAYGYERLIYDGYELQDGGVVQRGGTELSLDDFYELHLFDAETEFRANREGEEWNVSLARAADEVEDDDHFVFSETQFVQERFWVDGPDERIVVNNHFSFNEDGFLRLTGYRLAMEAGK